MQVGDKVRATADFVERYEAVTGVDWNRGEGVIIQLSRYFSVLVKFDDHVDWWHESDLEVIS